MSAHHITDFRSVQQVTQLVSLLSKRKWIEMRHKVVAAWLTCTDIRSHWWESTTLLLWVFMIHSCSVKTIQFELQVEVWMATEGPICRAYCGEDMQRESPLDSFYYTSKVIHSFSVWYGLPLYLFVLSVIFSALSLEAFESGPWSWNSQSLFSILRHFFR